MKISSIFKFSTTITTSLLLLLPLMKVTFANDFECIKNSDCIKVDTVCDGVLAINKKYIQKFKDLKIKAETDSYCGPTDKVELKRNKKLNAICEYKKCHLK